jgi:2-desacetyl-2-hydroxyethyl bacteriochlorophyllide A dehydrogenase
MINARRVSFPEPKKAVLEEFELDERLEGAQALIETEYSVISAGTEGASYTGLELEHPGRAATWNYPRLTTGYANLGRILEIGPEVRQFQPGDRVLTFAPHASCWKVDTASFALAVPPEAAGQRAVFTRMAGVAITALRKSSVSPGDTVVVTGLGLVGNFAAQLFQLAGAEVMGLDLTPLRLERAQACGLRHVTHVGERDAVEAVLEWTGQRGARIAVEAIGRSELVAQAVQFTRRHGEVILLGSPRARVTLDVTPMLSRVHLQGISIIGALEWLYPRQEVEGARVSIHQNYVQLLNWIQEGRLVVDPLRTHLLPPTACQEAYEGVTSRLDTYLGVVFDWNAA